MYTRPFFKIVLLNLIVIQCFAQTYDITAFGANGNGISVNTNAIQSAIDSCSATGGTVIVPAGTFVTGTLFLKNNVTLELQTGAVLKGSAWLWDYPSLAPTFISSFFTDRALIYAEGANNITIRGEGLIDGNGASAAFLLPSNKAKRPYGLRLISCKNVLVENIELKNSGFWMTQFLNCDSVIIRGIKLRNHSNSNNDGVNIDCSRNVLVENCDIDSFDDAVCLKTSSPAMCKNIEVRNCILASYNNVIKIGNETTGGFKNIFIHHCTVDYSDFGLGNRAAEAGIGVVIVDGGSMDSVIISDIDLKGIDTPFFIYLGNYGSKYTNGIPDPPVGSLKNVFLKNITAIAATNIVSWVAGLNNYRVQNIVLQNISLKVPGGENINNIQVPENEKGKARSIMFGEEFPCYGLFVRHAEQLTLDNVCVETVDADQRDMLYFEDTLAVAAFAIQQSGNKKCILNQNINTSVTNSIKEKIEISVIDKTVRVHLMEQQQQIKINVIDMFGRVVVSKTIAEEYSDLPLASLQSGMYLISIETNQRQFAQKIILHP